jgi:hypothetical protein
MRYRAFFLTIVAIAAVLAVVARLMLERKEADTGKSRQFIEVNRGQADQISELTAENMRLSNLVAQISHDKSPNVGRVVALTR